MAKAQYIYKTPTCRSGVTELRLSEAEARTLLTILIHVGGCPNTSLRAYVDSITRALIFSDVKAYEYLGPFLPEKSKLFFKDNTIDCVDPDEQCE